MKEISEEWLAELEATHQAVRAFSRDEVSSLARKVIYRLQRFPASGVYGDDLGHRTLWDEFCYEVQEGPFEGGLDISPASAWEYMVREFVEAVQERIPNKLARLLSIYAVWELEEQLERSSGGAIWPEGIWLLIEADLKQRAAHRDMVAFESR